MEARNTVYVSGNRTRYAFVSVLVLHRKRFDVSRRRRSWPEPIRSDSLHNDASDLTDFGRIEDLALGLAVARPRRYRQSGGVANVSIAAMVLLGRDMRDLVCGCLYRPK